MIKQNLIKYVLLLSAFIDDEEILNQNIRTFTKNRSTLIWTSVLHHKFFTSKDKHFEKIKTQLISKQILF